MLSSQLLAKFPIISDQISPPALTVVLNQLEKSLLADGDIVELGCYIGTSSLFIRRILNQTNSGKAFHVYDSFAGLPPKNQADQSVAGDQFKAGELSVSKKQLLTEFHKARLQPPIIHKAWFDQLTDRDLPDKIAFAFLDGDFYDSILTSLELVWPKLQPGGIICVDDYGREALPGVERAVKQFFNGRRQPDQVAHNIAIIRH